MWKKAIVLEDVRDWSSKKILFEKNEVINVMISENRLGYQAWEVVNSKYRNGFIFWDGSIEIVGDLYYF